MRRYVIEVPSRGAKKAMKALEACAIPLDISAAGGETALLVTLPCSASASEALDQAGIGEGKRAIHWVDEETGAFGSSGALRGSASKFACETMASVGIRMEPKLWRRLEKKAKTGAFGEAAAELLRRA